MQRIAKTLTTRGVSAVFAVLALIVGGVLIAFVGSAERTANPLDGLPRGADSTRAAELLQRLPQAEGTSAIVLFSRESGTLTAADRQVAEQRVSAAGQVARVRVVQLGPTSLQTSSDGTAAIAVLELDTADATSTATAVADIRTAIRADLPAGLRASLTGPGAVQADLAAVFEGANFRLLATTAGIVALLLIITYRSPVLFLVPLVVVGLADQVAAVVATHLLRVVNVPWDESTIGILSVLVFGAGTDYALLLISRYRDELRVQPDRRAAMVTAVVRTTEAITSSALTVCIGLLTLLLSLIGPTRGLGLACAVGVLVAASFVLLVLPAALVSCGRWIFWPRVPRVGQAVLVESQSLWRRVGDAVAARPTAYVGGTLVLLLAAALPLGQVRTGLSDSDQFLKKPEAISASERLAQSFPAGAANPTQIVTTADPSRVISAVRDVAGVDSTRPGASAGGVSQVSVVLSAQPGSSAARDAVRILRIAVQEVPGTYVGGSEAQALDQADAQARDRELILPIILGLVLLALIGLLRSLVAPLILVGSVVLTYLSSLGLGWLLFTQVLGFERLDGGVPLLAFVFLVALGVDYNIFLVTRAREESRTHGSRLGMLRGLGATGGVITSAGILLAAVFAVLGVLPLVVLAQLGVIICIGVLLDTLLVRTVLVPAIAWTLGDAFWWPRRQGVGT